MYQRHECGNYMTKLLVSYTRPRPTLLATHPGFLGACAIGSGRMLLRVYSRTTHSVTRNGVCCNFNWLRHALPEKVQLMTHFFNYKYLSTPVVKCLTEVYLILEEERNKLGMEINENKTKYIVKSTYEHRRNTGDLRIGNKTFEAV